MSDAEPAAVELPPKPSVVVLVHGAWHGAWCWATFQAELERRGVPSLAIDLPGHGVSPEPLTGLQGDAHHVAAVLDRLAELDIGPVVLVGHSYGGAVITQAAAGRDDIDHLAYVAAFALDDGESVLGALGSFDRRDVALSAAMVPTPDGQASTLDPATAPGALYGNCSDEAIAAAVRRLTPQPMATMTEEVGGSPRDSIESTYVICSQDRAVHPDHQVTMAERCTTDVTIDTDHSPFISAVSELADVIAPLADPNGGATSS